VACCSSWATTASATSACTGSTQTRSMWRGSDAPGNSASRSSIQLTRQATLASSLTMAQPTWPAPYSCR